MNTDDRDIVCEQDYTPLSNAELLTQIEQYTAIMYTSPIIDFDLEWITGPARALLARAEAAEAEAAESRAANGALAELAASETERRVALAERVAELEAQLASADDETASASAQAASFWRTNNKLAERVAELEAAQQWRPVTEDDPTPLEHVVIQTRDGADVGWRLPELRHLWQTRRGRTYVNEELRGWLALPPLPPPPVAAQEPTP